MFCSNAGQSSCEIPVDAEVSLVPEGGTPGHSGAVGLKGGGRSPAEGPPIPPAAAAVAAAVAVFVIRVELCTVRKGINCFGADPTVLTCHSWYVLLGVSAKIRRNFSFPVQFGSGI